MRDDTSIGDRGDSRNCSSLTRRKFLGASAATALVGTFIERPRAEEQASSPPLITKPIPATGEKLPVIGIGTDAFRGSVSDEIRTELGRMSELGGSVIDTAPAYGESESLIGAALKSLGTRSKVFLATKIVGSSFGGTSGRASFERSLERLATSRIDLLQVHNLNGIESLMSSMQEWKKAGQIRYIGATTSRLGQHTDLISVMRQYPLDFVQVDYSIANRDAAETVLPLAQERRMAVLVNLPFGRSSLFSKVADRKLPPWAVQINVTSWAQYFLKYVISHPAVTCAIPGSTKLSHLIDNQGAGRGVLADAALRRRMEEFWDGQAA